MTDTGNEHTYRTAVGAHSAWWRVVDRERVEITHLADRESHIATGHLTEYGAAHYSCYGIVFTDPPTLAQAHSLLPEFHALWCAVSEEFRRGRTGPGHLSPSSTP